MEIKASDVKTLREKTGAGMMDCKKALSEAQGDFAAAEKLLREWGMAGVEKRSDRSTNEGRIFVKSSDSQISLLEIACETDFVARNEDFIKHGEAMVSKVFASKTASITPDLDTEVKDIAAKIRENITLKRVLTYTAGANEIVHSYIHGEGSLAVLVKFKADKAELLKNAKVAEFIHDVALHIAAFNPMFLDSSKPEPAWIKEQEEIFRAQVAGDEKMKDKPAKVIDGIIPGKMKKLLADLCLLEQGFVKDEKLSVQKVLESLSKEVGAKLEIIDYQYIKIGA